MRFALPDAPLVAIGVSLVAVMMRVTGVVTVAVAGVEISVDVTEPVLATRPAVASAAVTTCEPERTHVAFGASVAQVLEFGVSLASVTTTLFCVTVPEFVAVTLKAMVSPTVSEIVASLSV